MKQLGAIDASSLYTETAQTPLHAGSLCILEPRPGRSPAAFHDEFKAHLERRMHLAPMLGKTLGPELPDRGGPGWIDAEHVDLDHHVRRISLPRPGSRRQLEGLVARLHSNPLDHARPPWEFHVIEGVEGGRAALYVKLHHALLDGEGGALLTGALFDDSADPRQVAPPQAPAAEAEPEAPAVPSLLEFIGSAQKSLMRQQMRTWQMIPEAWQAWTRAVLPGATASQPEPPADAAPEPPAAPRTPLNGTVTSQRSYAARALPLAALEGVARDTGTRLEDVVLAACAAALRRWLLERRALPDEPLVALVPLAPAEAGGGEGDAAAPALLVGLATDVADPLQRLRRIAGAAEPDRRQPAAPAGGSIFGASLRLSAAPGAQARPNRAGQAPLPANVSVSTAPGPAVPLYLAGARLTAVHPVSIATHGVAVSVAAQRYGEELGVGVTACRHLLAEPSTLLGYLLDGLEELQRSTAGPVASGAAEAAASGDEAGGTPAARQPVAGEQPAGAAEPAMPPEASEPSAVAGPAGAGGGPAPASEAGAASAEAAPSDAGAAPAPAPRRRGTAGGKPSEPAAKPPVKSRRAAGASAAPADAAAPAATETPTKKKPRPARGPRAAADEPGTAAAGSPPPPSDAAPPAKAVRKRAAKSAAEPAKPSDGEKTTKSKKAPARARRTRA